MSPSLHANVSHLHQKARYPLRAWLTALVAVTVLGLLTGIHLMAAPINARWTVKVVVGKHPPKARRAAAEAERIIKYWIPVLDGWVRSSTSRSRCASSSLTIQRATSPGRVETPSR